MPVYLKRDATDYCALLPDD